MKSDTLQECERHGSLVLDEMKLAMHRDLDCSSNTQGFVDLGPFTQEEDKHARADDGLVLMFESFAGT